MNVAINEFIKVIRKHPIVYRKLIKEEVASFVLHNNLSEKKRKIIISNLSKYEEELLSILVDEKTFNKNITSNELIEKIDDISFFLFCVIVRKML